MSKLPEPVAYWVPKAEQFAIPQKGCRPFAKAFEPLYPESAVTALQARITELEAELAEARKDAPKEPTA